MNRHQTSEAQRRDGIEDASAVIEWGARLLAVGLLAGLLWSIAAMVAGVVGAVRAIWGAL